MHAHAELPVRVALEVDATEELFAPGKPEGLPVEAEGSEAREDRWGGHWLVGWLVGGFLVGLVGLFCGLWDVG